MAGEKTAAFAVRDGKLVTAAPYVEAYFPRAYFDDAISEWNGEKLKTLCVFEFRAFAKEGSQPGPMRLMAMPLVGELSFSSTYDDGEGENARSVLQFRQGEVVMESLIFQKSAENVKLFVKLVHSGKIPAALPYDEVMQTYADCMALNGIDLGVPSSVLEATVAELHRDPAVPAIPYRMGKMTSPPFRTSLKRLGMLSSTFAAVTFEDMGQSVVASVARSRKGLPEATSPVEKTLGY